MLSYQHAYHAGNMADIHKHGSLAVLLSHMRKKPKPMTYMETHAGQGLYDLAAVESKKTGEAEQGIVKRLARGVPPLGHPYRTVIEQVRAKHGKTAYPGSPLIAHALLNPDDPQHLMELHPAEYEGLRRNMAGTGAHIHFRDGFEGVLSISPPPPGQPRRGLVFIDPSYEIKSDYRLCAEFVLELHKKWAEAVIVLWYPVLDYGLHMDMTDILYDANLPGLMRREVRFESPKQNHRLLGSGLFIVKPPFGSEKALDEVESWLAS